MTEDEPPNAQPFDDPAKIRHRLRSAAHDLRSLLGPIVGFAELIAVADDIDQCRAHAARIAQAAARLERLADGLADRILLGEGPEDSFGAG